MATAFSFPQLKAALWAERGVRVHAVIDGRVVPELPQQLGAAAVVGWDCLQRGALAADAARRAPYLVELDPAAPFTDWLLAEASATYPGWGVLLVSQQPLLPMREHCRALADVVSADGERRAWRWYDPELLQLLLPTLAPGQLDEFFGAGQAVVVVTATAWTWYALEQGVLASTARIRMAAAA
jgi:hypothetical protein